MASKDIIVYELVDARRLLPFPEILEDRPPSLETQSDAMLFMPRVYCPTCGSCRFGLPIPEAAFLAADCSLLVRIRELNRREKRILRSLNRELFALVAQYDPKTPPDDDPLWRRFDEEPAVSPAEFGRLAEDLRSALNLPAGRPIWPHARLGKLELKCNDPYFGDFDFDSPFTDSLVVRREVVSALEADGITGWASFEIGISRAKSLGDFDPPDMREMIAVGEAGLPSTDSDPFTYEECATCGISRFDPFPDKLFLDPTSWDEADMFHFKQRSTIFVTERAKRTIERLGFSGVLCRPSNVPTKEWRREVGLDADNES